jgi:hypothetical protein
VTKQEYKELDYPSFLLIKKHLAKVSEMDIVIKGISMLPLFSKSSQVVKVQYIEDEKSLKRFDIIVFWQNNILVSHYFWGRNKYFNENPNDPDLITRPLNPIKGFDHPVKYEHILGIIPEKIGFFLRLKILFNIMF